jgi:hypothetical protein
LDPAVTSFLRGFEVALIVAGVILAAAGVVGWRGLRHLTMPQASPPPSRASLSAEHER